MEAATLKVGLAGKQRSHAQSLTRFRRGTRR
jgi:hypothetical protein